MITMQQAARLLVLLVSIGITYGVACLIKWIQVVNSNDLDFIQLVQFVLVFCAIATVVQFVVFIRACKYPNN